MTSAAAVLEAPLTAGGTMGADPLQNRFLVSAVAFLRARQLQLGSRPRVEPEGHKVTHIAVLEVLADTISWSHTPPPLSAKV